MITLTSLQNRSKKLFACFILAIAIQFGCITNTEKEAERPTAKSEKIQDEIEVLKENTVDWVSETDVGVANFFEDTYLLSNGDSTYGPSAEVFIGEDLNLRVGTGSEFNIKNDRWKVLNVQLGQDGEASLLTLIIKKKSLEENN